MDRGVDGVDLVVEAVRKHIPLPIAMGEEHNYASLPLCVIDAVFSIGVRYSSTRATVLHWCKSQTPPWDVLRSDTSKERSNTEFLAILDGCSAEELAGPSFFNNRQRTSPRGGILKAEAVREFAKVLHDFGIDRLADVPKKIDSAKSKLLQIKGQVSGISLEYFLLLAGSDNDIKADRMVCRFIGNALGLESPASPELARKLLPAAAQVIGVTPRELDHGIWSFQRAVPNLR